MFNKLKNIKDLRSQAKNIQDELAKETATAEAAWGKVKVTINGNQEVLQVEIAPEMMDNKEKLEEALKEAFNSSVKKVQRAAAMKMQQMGGLQGLGL